MSAAEIWILGGTGRTGRDIAARLAAAGFGSHALRLRLPDGTVSTTGAWPSGDLVTAARASGAADVVAATSEVPAGAAIHAVVPVAGPLLRIGPLKRFAIRRLAARRFEDAPRPREHSWGHARAEWADGTVREAWLRTGDAGVFTADVAAAVAARIARGTAQPGACTPVSAVGLEVVEESGAVLLLT